MPWRGLHLLIGGLYIAAPVAAMFVDAFRARKQQRHRPGGWLIGIVLAGVLVGTAMAVLYSVAVGGKVRIGQAMLASYFAMSMLLILRFFDWLLHLTIASIYRVNRPVEKPTIGFRF